MKVFFKIIPAALILLMAALLVLPANAQSADKKEKKMLVVYYSHSGNTREIANLIQKETEADTFEIQTEKPYPKEYNDVVNQAKEEINKGCKPALKSKVNNLKDYDVIFVGSPNWWSTIAPPVTAFLSENDLSGKTVVPFCTHGGGGMAGCAADIAKLTPKSVVLEGAAFSGSRAGGAQKDVAAWLKKIGM